MIQEYFSCKAKTATNNKGFLLDCNFCEYNQSCKNYKFNNVVLRTAFVLAIGFLMFFC